MCQRETERVTKTEIESVCARAWKRVRHTGRQSEGERVTDLVCLCVRERVR